MKRPWTIRNVLLAALACAVGCGTRPAGGVRTTSAGVAVANLPPTASDNVERLSRLQAERGVRHTMGDYRLGPGDLVSVRAIGLDELTQKVRVDGAGNIELPLVGGVPVAGKTVAEAQRALTQRLGDFMFSPRASLFVEEYRSQQVAVVGAVQRPGLVSLTADHSTVLDALSAAGGMTPDSGGRVYLIPSNRSPGDPMPTPAALAQAGVVTQDPIMLDVKELGDAAQTFFALPVAPGDVIMVPAAGEFIVEGWVVKPGSYPIKSSLTLRGAIATGGGLTFAANASRVRLHRLTTGGKTESHELDYAAIVAEREPDVLIHDGDVIEVSSSSVRLVPYAVYKLAVDMIHVGAGIRVVP